MERKPKEIRFENAILLGITNGKELITIRKHRKWIHDFREGDLFAGDFDKIKLILKATADTKKVLFKDILDSTAQKAGYESSETLFKTLKEKYYENLVSEDIAAIISFTAYREPDGKFLQLRKSEKNETPRAYARGFHVEAYKKRP